VVSLSVLRADELYPKETSLILVSVRDWVDPRVVVRSEELSQWNIPLSQPGVEPSTFRLLCLNQLRHRVLRRCVYSSENYSYIQMTLHWYYASACSIQTSIFMSSSSTQHDLKPRTAEDFASITEMSAAMVIYWGLNWLLPGI